MSTLCSLVFVLSVPPTGGNKYQRCNETVSYCLLLSLLSLLEEPTVRMADAETLLMETSDQNGNEGDEDQNGAEQELMIGEECQDSQDGQDEQDDQDGQDSQDNGTDGGKIDASKGEEDAG